MVWSSRRTASRALLGLGLSAALGEWGCANNGRQKPSDRVVARTSLMLRRLPATDTGKSGSRAPLALWLVLSSIPATIQRALLDVAELALDVAEANALLLGSDLSSQDLLEALGELQPQLLPVHNSARHLAGWPWRAADGRLIQPLTVSGHHDGLISVWPAERGTTPASERNIQFAAWSLCHGIMLDCGDAQGVARMRAQLCQFVTQVSSPPALLIDSRTQRLDSDLIPKRRFLELQRRARALRGSGSVRQLGDAHALWVQLLAGLRAPSLTGTALPWLKMRESELLVVPKLGGLTRGNSLLALFEAARRRVGGTLRVVRNPS